jgi:hypothetical protein
MSKTTTKKITEHLKMNEEIDSNSEFSTEPSNNVINNILNFSKALSIKKLKNESYVELVLN